MPRYVILEHDHPVLHWDLMLERGDVLRAWRLATPPTAGKAVPGELIFDHRRLYLDYVGPVSGNRGTVRRWDAGTFTWIEEREDRVAVRLEGERVRGVAVLTRCSSGAWEFALEAPE